MIVVNDSSPTWFNLKASNLIFKLLKEATIFKKG